MGETGKCNFIWNRPIIVDNYLNCPDLGSGKRAGAVSVKMKIACLN